MIGSARVGRSGFWGTMVLLIAALGFTTMLAGCTSPRIRVEASDPAALQSAPGFEVVLAPPKAGEGVGVDSATAAAFVDRAYEALRAKGHRVNGDARDAFPLELALRKEQVSRRSFSADTDASGTRLVKRIEAIVALRLLDASGKTELWRCEARGQIPEKDLRFGPSPSKSTNDAEIFERVLERALARIPARP